MDYSFSPEGERFPLPKPEDYPKEFARLEALAAERRAEGKQNVVAVGVGFVGAVMAGVIADRVDAKPRSPGKLVIGGQRPSPRPDGKIPLPNRGIVPVSPD